MKNSTLLLSYFLTFGMSLASASSTAPKSDHHKGVAPEKALQWLKNGNIRFSRNRLRRDGQSQQDRSRLSQGQQPHTIVVSCSDSRVPPEMVFDQKLGELFVVRTAGEVLDYGAIASIEYAVEHLGAHLILVMGHESCGAVRAAIETPVGKSAGSPDLDKLVMEIRPRIASSLRQPASQNLISETSANARGAAEDLLKKSEILRNHVKEGNLVVKSAVYHLASGIVNFDR